MLSSELSTKKLNNLETRPLVSSVYLKSIFRPNHVVGTQKNRLNETVILLSIQNI